MKLRRRSARVLHQEAGKARPFANADQEVASEEDIEFKPIVEPFSPAYPADSDDAENAVADDWALKHKKQKKIITKQRSNKDIGITKKPKNKRKSLAKRKEPIEPDNDIELELEDVIDDDSKLNDVKAVLENFPVFFVKSYIKYLHASKNSSISAKVAVPKKKNIIPYSIVKEDVSAKICVICKEEFKDNRMLAQHMRQHAMPDGYTCICKKVWKDFKAFWTHVVRGHGQKYKCVYCDSLTFEGLELLRQHSQEVHSTSYAYLCSICDKGFSKEFRFLEHINNHTGLKPHQCHLCDRTYKCADARREHIGMRHSGSDFKCSKCDRVFLCKRTFGDHMLSHGTERKYICKECGKSFKTRTRLAHHRESHRFRCENCSCTFPSENRLIKHVDKMHGDPLAVTKGNIKGKKSLSLKNDVKKHESKGLEAVQQDDEDLEGSLSESESTASSTGQRNLQGSINDCPAFLDPIELKVNSEPLYLNNGISCVMDIECDSSDDEKRGSVLLSL